MNHFSDLSLSAVLKRNLAAHGFVNPTPVQAAAIPPALERRDVVATAQTGTGKTLAFVLPMLEQLLEPPVAAGVQAVIVTPTRELAIQIHETFAKLAHGTPIKAAVVVGGLNENSQLHNIRRGAQVLVATPGRLNDFLDRRLVKLDKVHLLVLDEADRMLDMGFMPSIRRILAELPEHRQTLMFSATFPPQIGQLTQSMQRDPVRLQLGPIASPAKDVRQRMYTVHHEKKLSLLSTILRGPEVKSALVFLRTKHRTERVAKALHQAGFKAQAIHGDRSQRQRQQAIDGFRQGRYNVLVATDVAARGLDVRGITHVVNFDLPNTSEDYIHRIGRTARANASGDAITFVGPDEFRALRDIENAIGKPIPREEWEGAIAVPTQAPRSGGVRPFRTGRQRNESRNGKRSNRRR